VYRLGKSEAYRFSTSWAVLSPSIGRLRLTFTFAESHAVLMAYIRAS
jgi:hypothetical protein